MHTRRRYFALATPLFVSLIFHSVGRADSMLTDLVWPQSGRPRRLSSNEQPRYNDGNFDLFAGNFSHPGQPQSRFLENLGSGGATPYSFNDRGTGGLAWQESYASPALGDYDNDGDLDLFFTTVYSGDNPVLYRNDGNWNFTDVTATEGLSGLGQTYQAAWADFDSDGDLDLVTDGKMFVNNESQTNTNHWLKVKMAGNGTTINRAAIGSEVRINVGGQILTRQVEGGTGAGNQNDLTLHFGLGSHAGPVPLEVRWPDGTVETTIADPDQMVELGYGFSACHVERVLPETYSDRLGEAIPVTLRARHVPAAVAVVETFPAAWTVADPAGGDVAANTISFSLDQDQEITYELLPGESCETAVLDGVVQGADTFTGSAAAMQLGGPGTGLAPSLDASVALGATSSTLYVGAAAPGSASGWPASLAAWRSRLRSRRSATGLFANCLRIGSVFKKKRPAPRRYSANIRPDE